jgi:hypothetical protein
MQELFSKFKENTLKIKVTHILTLLKLIVNKLLKFLFTILSKVEHYVRQIISQAISRKKIIHRLITKNKNFYINSRQKSKYNFFWSYKKK